MSIKIKFSIYSSYSAQNPIGENTSSEVLSTAQNATASVTLAATSENDASVTVTAREGEHAQDDRHVEDGCNTADEHRFETHEVLTSHMFYILIF